MKNPRHILITGASSGLGAALALAYAEKGVLLSLGGRHKERLAQVARAATEKGADVFQTIVDVTDQTAMQHWLAQAHAQRPLDLVIANAGISAGTGSGDETKEQSDRIFATNLHGVLNTIHPVLPLMTARGCGQIAIISSLAGFRGIFGAPSYCASKAAARVYGESLRGEYGPLGVEISVVCPGFIKTPMTDINPFPMPFLIEADQAAHIIRRGLFQNKARIAFPRPMIFLIALLFLLPFDWMDRRLRRFPSKP